MILIINHHGVDSLPNMLSKCTHGYVKTLMFMIPNHKVQESSQKMFIDDILKIPLHLAMTKNHPFIKPIVMNKINLDVSKINVPISLYHDNHHRIKDENYK
jgi:hypothetical protein